MEKKSLKVLLINPPLQRLLEVKNQYFHLGLGYLAAVLEREGYHVAIYNAERTKEEAKFLSPGNLSRSENYYKYLRALKEDNHPVWQDIKRIISKYAPDVVGITVVTGTFPSALQVASIIKECNPKSLVVTGGPHPTILPDETVKQKNIDFVVRGEGEIALLELIRAIEKHDYDSFEKIDGLSFKKNGEIIHNRPRQFIQDLDSLPFPARHLSLFPELHLPREMGVMISLRGCPFDCDFCGAKNIWTRKVRYRSIDNVADEIKHIMRNYKNKEFLFWDDSFTANKKRTLDLCQKLTQEKFGIIWSCITRADILDEELIRIMKKAGCSRVDIGIESGSERILKLINKKITIEDVLRTSQLLKNSGLDWGAFFMVGFPYETKQDVLKTKELMQKLKPTNMVLSIYTPFPGDKLFDVTKQMGLLPEKPNWAEFTVHNPDKHFVKDIPKDEFKTIVNAMIAYSNKISGIMRPHVLLKKIYVRRYFYLKNPFLFFKKSLVYSKSFLEDYKFLFSRWIANLFKS